MSNMEAFEEENRRISFALYIDIFRKASSAYYTNFDETLTWVVSLDSWRWPMRIKEGSARLVESDCSLRADGYSYVVVHSVRLDGDTGELEGW